MHVFNLKLHVLNELNHTHTHTQTHLYTKCEISFEHKFHSPWVDILFSFLLNSIYCRTMVIVYHEKQYDFIKGLEK